MSREDEEKNTAGHGQLHRLEHKAPSIMAVPNSSPPLSPPPLAPLPPPWEPLGRIPGWAWWVALTFGPITVTGNTCNIMQCNHSAPIYASR